MSSVLCPPSSSAQVPALINYQGRLLDGTNLVNGNVGLSLRLFSGPAGGSSLYEDSNTVTVADGLYATFIGDHPTNGAFLAALTNAELWVEAAVAGTTLAPRERVAAVAFSLGTRGLLVDERTNTIHQPAINWVEPGVLGVAIGGGIHHRVGDNSDQSTVAGGRENEVWTNSVWATVGGGFSNVVRANSAACTIAGGRNNRIGQDAEYATVGGGIVNWIEDVHLYAAIAGGSFHLIGSNGRAGVIGGGYNNEIQALVTNGTIAGGADHVIATGAHHAVIGGGLSNRVTGRYGIVPGGDQNQATNYAFAAGQRAKARHDGAFVWGDSTGADVASTNAKSVTFRAGGGYRLFSDTNLTLGAQLPPNATAWAAISDRNAKENFVPIDTGEILDRVAQLPLTAWTYKADPEHRRYIGPVAQDFHAAFGLGNDTTISTIDADGVAVAAIQALARENAKLKAKTEELEARLRVLEAK